MQAGTEMTHTTTNEQPGWTNNRWGTLGKPFVQYLRHGTWLVSDAVEIVNAAMQQQITVCHMEYIACKPTRAHTGGGKGPVLTAVALSDSKQRAVVPSTSRRGCTLDTTTPHTIGMHNSMHHSTFMAIAKSIYESSNTSGSGWKSKAAFAISVL